MTDSFGRDLIALLPNLRRFAISLTKSRDIADDLVQTTCEKALASRDSYVAGTRLDAWLFRIMKNAWIDRLRRTRTEGVQVDIDDTVGLVGQDGGKTTENRLMLDATAKAIAELPDDQREIILLVCVEDLSYRDAAEVLGVPIGTVMSRLARGRQKLVDVLGINGEPARLDVKKGASP